MNDEDKQAFLTALGLNIKRLREAQDMSQDELAHKCGYDSDNSRSTIQKIESGKNDIPASKLKKIADALGTTATDLMNSASQMQQEKKCCDLFEKCYGKDAYHAVEMYLQLDERDRGKVEERIASLLEQDKYALKKESSDAQAI